MAAARRQQQALTAETVSLAGVSYPCTVATTLAGSLEFEQGGALNIQHISINVEKDDLRNQPAVNTPAVFRGNELRVKSVDDAQGFWEIMLVQEFA